MFFVGGDPSLEHIDDAEDEVPHPQAQETLIDPASQSHTQPPIDATFIESTLGAPLEHNPNPYTPPGRASTTPVGMPRVQSPTPPPKASTTPVGTPAPQHTLAHPSSQHCQNPY